MATVLYPAIVEETETGFSVFFPDVPGCVSAGRSVEEAFAEAEIALAAHIQLSAEHGEDIPSASRVGDIPHDPEVNEVARILIRTELPGKAVRLNITLDESLVASIDRVAKNRSGFLAEAAREALAKRRELEAA